MPNGLKAPFIKLDDAQCFYCDAPIVVYEYEANSIYLSKEGIPNSTEPIKYKILGVCPRCGRTYNVKRNGIGYRITSSDGCIMVGGKDDDETNVQQPVDHNEFGCYNSSSR